MEDYIYRKARKRVKQKKGFFIHFSVYIAVGVFFLTMNLVTDPWDLWFFYPLLPWGVALLIHYFSIFGLPGKERVLTQKWEEKEMEKEIQRLEKLKRRHEGEPTDSSDSIDSSAPTDYLDLPELHKRKEKIKTRKGKWNEDDLV